MKVWLLFVLTLVSPLLAQDIDEVAQPPAPQGRILDDARLFTLEPESLARLSDRLMEVSARTGYEVYVAIFDSLIGSSVKEQASLLQKAWVGDKPGVVLVLESDSSMYELGWSRTPDSVTESGEKMPLLGESDLAPQERVRILIELSSLHSAEKESTEAAEILIRTFVGGIDRAFQKVEVAEPPRWNAKVLMLGTGLLAAMLLAGLLIGAWIRRSDQKMTERLLFPEVTVGMRLGAPCGGGKISSRSFDVLPGGKA